MAAAAIIAQEYGPVPRIIGIGPMSITAPPLNPPSDPVSGPTTISKKPIAIIAKAMNDSHVAAE